MVAVVSSNPIGGNFIFCWNFSNPSMSILYRNVRFVLKTKNPIDQHRTPGKTKTHQWLDTLPPWESNQCLTSVFVLLCKEKTRFLVFVQITCSACLRILHVCSVITYLGRKTEIIVHEEQLTSWWLWSKGLGFHISCNFKFITFEVSSKDR